MLRRFVILGFVAGAAVVAACVSTQQELALGRQYAAEINQQLPIVEDADIHAFINELGNRIQRQPGTRDIPYTFYVVNIEQVNAFAIPGGLAGVVGHEIGHVEGRHGAEQLERMQAANAGYAVATVLLGHRPKSSGGSRAMRAHRRRR